MARKKVTLKTPTWRCLACFGAVDPRSSFGLLHRSSKAIKVSPSIACRIGFAGSQCFAIHQTCWSLMGKQSTGGLWALALTTEMTGTGHPEFTRKTIQASLSHTIRTFCGSVTIEDYSPLASILNELAQLPDELQNLTVQHMDQSCFQRVATVLFQAIPFVQGLQKSRTYEFRKQILDARSSDVFVRWSHFAGRKYVSDITLLPQNDGEYIQLTAQGNTVIIAIDALGCRSFHKDPHTIRSVDTWFRLVDFSQELVAIYKGLHLRDLIPRFLPNNSSRHWVWDTPSVPDIPPQNCFHQAVQQELVTSPVMRYHPCQDDMVGISAACQGGSTFLLHIHTGDNAADESFYNYGMSLGVPLEWLFYPLWPGESLAQLFVRYAPQDHSLPASLVAITSLRRCFTLGPYVEEISQASFVFIPLVHSELPHIQAICLNDRSLSNYAGCPLVCAVQCGSGVPTIDYIAPCPTWPLPQTPHPSMGTPNRSIYLFEASLEGTKAFKTQHSCGNGEVCTGILFATMMGDVVLGTWRSNGAASEWNTVDHGLSVRNCTVENKARVSVRSGYIQGQGWEHANLQAKLTWWRGDEGDWLGVSTSEV